MAGRPIIAPSVLASDLSCLKDEAERMISEGCDWLHLDVMVSQCTFHYEAVDGDEEAMALIRQIKERGMRAGLAIKPKTELKQIEKVLRECAPDMLLVMTVEPGFGGQKFMVETMTKVFQARKICPDLDIQVDGGLDAETVKEAAASGANVIVAGTSIYKAESPRVLMEYMRDVIVASQTKF